MKKNTLFVLLILLFININASQKETIQFQSKDSLEITADLYLINNLKETPFILLCHQANWSRGEYVETAPKLNELGFNCMAIDQRSGNKVNEVINETNLNAVEAKKGTNYEDALHDILAAIEYIKEKYQPEKLIIVGSSYSSALVLKIAGDYPNDIQGVLSYSPGEYFEKYGTKTSTWISESAKNIKCPVFITAAQHEKADWLPIYNVINPELRTSFEPETKGQHGSRALWSMFEDSKDYWKATSDFLTKHFTK